MDGFYSVMTGRAMVSEMLLCTFFVVQRSSHLLPNQTGYIPCKSSSSPPALPYRTSNRAASWPSCLFPMQVTAECLLPPRNIPCKRAELTSRRTSCLRLCAATRGMQHLSRMLPDFPSSSLAGARASFFKLTIHHHPPSTASSTPFHQSPCQTRGAPSSPRPYQCASRRRASTGKEIRSQPSIVLARPEAFLFYFIFPFFLNYSR